MKPLFYFLFAFIFLYGCSGDNSSNTSATAVASDILGSAADAYNKNKTSTSANNYIKVLLSEIAKPEISSSQKKSLLEKGLAVSDEMKMGAPKLSFLYPLIRSFSDDQETESRLVEMADVMKGLNKNEGANVIYYNLASKAGTTATDKLSEPISNIDDYIKMLGEKIFDNPDFNGVNKSASQNYVDACESYALSNAGSTESAGYLFKAAEIARTIRTFPKVMSLYDWIIESYPNFEKAPTVLFLKGFVIENDIQNVDMARDVYNQFLEKHPSHELADDVKFLLEHLGKTDEEILQIIESKKKG